MSPEDHESNQEISSTEKIRDAAIRLFGEHGFRGTPLKAIAAEAGVSQALIIHHFRSKQGLRAACDEHVARAVRARKEDTIRTPGSLDPFSAMHQLRDSPQLLRYLTRALTEGGEHTAELIDDMLEDALEYMELGESAGLIKPSRTPRDRAALLLLWSLGALTLHEHVARLLGVDFLSTSATPEELGRYLLPSLELFSQGLMTEHSADELMAALAGEGEAPSPPPAPHTSDPLHDEEH